MWVYSGSCITPSLKAPAVLANKGALDLHASFRRGALGPGSWSHTPARAVEGQLSTVKDNVGGMITGHVILSNENLLGHRRLICQGCSLGDDLERNRCSSDAELTRHQPEYRRNRSFWLNNECVHEQNTFLAARFEGR